MKRILLFLLVFSVLTNISSQNQKKFTPQTIHSLEVVTSLDSDAPSEWFVATDELNPEEFSRKYLETGENNLEWIKHEIPSKFNKADNGKPDIKKIWIAKSLFFPATVQTNSISVRLGVISDRDRTYFNGVLIGATGEFGKPYPSAYDKVRIYEIPDNLIRKGAENLLLVEAEEYFNTTVGIDQDKTEIGPSRTIEKSFINTEYVKLVLLMIYLVVGIYYLFLFARRRKEKENFIFGIFTIMLVLYQIMRNQLRNEFDFNFVLMKKCEYMMIAAVVPVFAHFIRHFFKFKWNIVEKIADGALFLIFLYELVVTDIKQYNFINANIVQPIWIVYMILIFYFLIVRMIQKNMDAVFIFLGVVVIFCALVVDTLSTRGVIIFPKIMGYAFFFFISSLAIILANRSVRLHEEVEELNANLEKKVAVRTEELSLSLENVKKLKMSQDGDYFLTSLLIKPLGKNRAEKNQVLIDFIVKQKKTFEFKNKVSDLGGDLCRAESLVLRERNMTVFFNADAMGKSMQGAGGALVMGSVFDSILERTKLSKSVQEEYPEKWLKNSFIELHKVFESFQGSMLVSIVMGLIDNRTGLMYFINAEHPVSIIYRDGKASFIDEDFIFRKLGTEVAQSYIYVKTFQMKDGDIVINGSDGRDDIILPDEKTGEKSLNYDHTLFLGTVEESSGDINKMVDILYKKGEITDDLSLMSIKFVSQEPLIESETARKRITALIHEKNFSEAALVAEDHLTLNPSDTECIFLLSYSYKKLQKFKEAIRAGERVRLREPGHIRNLVNLAHCYFRMKDIDRAKYLASLIPEGGREKAFAKIFLIES
ncbi:MAG: SpoIIE family protein phosphatase [Leptospiraceae bacterium]|nr:SpoIIE family protein phosphatase [Leptospiraceae bacterium]